MSFLCVLLATFVAASAAAKMERFDMTMPGVTTNKDDAYLCLAYKLPHDNQELYLVGLETRASMSVAHHVLIYGCSEPLSTQTDKAYDCGSICRDDSQIVYAWARAAPPLTLPKNVAFRVGAGTRVRYLVLQVHYAKRISKPDSTRVTALMSPKPQPFAAGIFLMLAYYGSIPGNSKHVHLDVACRYTGRDTLYPFAFRTHAHTLGRTIVAYRLSPDLGEVQEIGRGSPQWPQAFYPANTGIVIRPGDFVAARCIFDSVGRSRTTVIGATHKDEMCNFYMMYFTRSSDLLTPEEGLECGGRGSPEIWDAIPQDSLAYLPVHKPGGPGPKAHASTSSDSTSSKRKSKPSAEAHHHPEKAHRQKVQPPTEVPHWPKLGHMKTKLGQVSGIAVDKRNHLHVFHRGPRTWQMGTFRYDHQLADGYRTPLPMDTVIELDEEGKYVQSWGSNMFYLPHGISIDHNGDFWLTDVGAHQVYKFKKGKWDKPVLTLGVALEPGRGQYHYCQPADVAVSTTGVVFVADGYCNDRIVKLDMEGNFLGEIHSAHGKFEIPHSVAVDDVAGLVCVADRERARVECFDFDGRSKRVLAPKDLGESVYAIAIDKTRKDTMYVVNGPGVYDTSIPVQGFTMDSKSGGIRSAWGAGKSHEFGRPHDVAISPDGQCLFVAEIGPNRVWKFHVAGAPNRTATGGSGRMVVKGNLSVQPGKLSKNDLGHLLKGSSNKVSFIIGLCLVVPVVLILIVVACSRARRGGCLRPGSVKNRRYGPLFRERNGFSPLNQDDSDPETENLTKLSAADKPSLKA